MMHHPTLTVLLLMRYNRSMRVVGLNYNQVDLFSLKKGLLWVFFAFAFCLAYKSLTDVATCVAILNVKVGIVVYPGLLLHIE